VVQALVAGQPDKSKLYIATSSGKMPPDDAQLTEQELGAIWYWIQDGAPEN
jgi:hypothetical protein